MEYKRTIASVNVLKLDTELKASAISGMYTGMTQTGTEVVFYFNKSMNAAQIAVLDQTVSDHQPELDRTFIKGKILGAMQFGADLMADYGTTRVLRGTSDVETLEVLNALSLLELALLSGSLKAARLILLDMEPTTLIPQADIDTFLHRINKFLGIV